MRPETAANHSKGLVLIRRFLASTAFIAATFFCCAAAQAETLIHVGADTVNFYYDRFLLEAQGNVRVTTSDGMTMTGDAFSMNLKLNRFVLAGHVHVQDPSGAQDGAALADFLDFNRIYLDPIVPGPSGNPLPDRWTFINGDFKHPAKGREMPGDTFFFPDLGNARPFIIADKATIGSRSFIRFGGNRLDIANGLGAYVPTPSYYINFSTDRHLGENSLAGANFDATWQVAGGANAISAVHIRYDTLNKAYLSFEQHVSGQKAYAVFSLNPVTRPSKFWNLRLADQPSDSLEFQSFTQLHTFQHGLTRPDESGQFTTFLATKAFRQSSLQLTVQDTNSSLLPEAPPGIGYHGHGPVIDHPWQMNLSSTTFSHRVGLTPIYERLSFGMGYVHDTNHEDRFNVSQPLQVLQGTPYWTIWNHSADYMLYVPSFKLGNSFFETGNYYVNASFEDSRTWYSVPHYTDVQTTRLSLTKVFDRHFSGFLDYGIQNLGDHYGKLQSLVYPSFVPVVNGVKYPGYAAFRGLATFRALGLDLTYANNGNFSASILARKHDDFPGPIPNYFQPPPLDILGNYIAGENYLGEPPYDITADVRFRVNSHMSIDVSRAYFFNFGNRGWSPQFVIQVSQ